MKKLIIAFIPLLFLMSCGSKKEIQTTEKSFKGSWVVSDITFDGFRKYEVNLLRDADSECFKISSWDFVSNNNRGNYNINNDLCQTGERKFIWVYDESASKVTIKPTDDNYKSENNVGFAFQILSVTENTMTWTQTLQIDGGPVVMKINFTKNNQ